MNFLEILTRAWLASGRRAEAKRTAEMAQQRAQKFGLGLSTAGADLATAAVALEAGDARLAPARALAGAENADRVGARLAAGLSRSLAGRAFAALGQTERAAAELERAVSTLEACGARRHVAAAERELRRMKPPTASGEQAPPFGSIESRCPVVIVSRHRASARPRTGGLDSLPQPDPGSGDDAADEASAILRFVVLIARWPR